MSIIVYISQNVPNYGTNILYGSES